MIASEKAPNAHCLASLSSVQKYAARVLGLGLLLAIATESDPLETVSIAGSAPPFPPMQPQLERSHLRMAPRQNTSGRAIRTGTGCS